MGDDRRDETGKAALRRRNRSILLSVLAALVEGYDATAFTVYALVVAARFFDSRSPANSILLVMGAFGAGYLIRPLGAILLGLYADRFGRRRSVALIVVVMSAATGVIGLLPEYASIGIAASIVVVAARLLHGLAAGGSTATGTLYIAELAPKDHRGLFVSVKQSASVASFLMAALCGAIFLNVAAAKASAWEWRMPFLVAFLLGGAGLVLQRLGQETTAFKAAEAKPHRPVALAFARYKYRLTLALLSGALHNSSALAILLFMPTYAVTRLHMSLGQVTLAGTVSSVIIIAANTLGGAIADRFGFKRTMLVSGALTAIATIPCFAYLQASPGVPSLIVLQSVLGALSAPFCAVNLAYKARLFPVETRATCLSITNSLSTLLFVGSAAPVIAWMLQHGYATAPGDYLMVTAVVSCLALLLIRRDMLFSLDAAEAV